MERRVLLAGEVIAELEVRGNQRLVVDDRVYFTAFDPVPREFRMAVSDGTAAGTRTLAGDYSIDSFDINTRSIYLTNVGSSIYFNAPRRNAAVGGDLFRVDLATYSAVRITDSPAYKGPSAPVVLNGTLYFVYSSEAGGTELYRSGGNVGDTTLAVDLLPGPESGVAAVAAIDGKLYISGWHEGKTAVYVSDGTQTGTTLLTQLDSSYEVRRFAETSNGVVFFSGADVWVTDGTAAGTSKIVTLPGDNHQRYRMVKSNGEFALFIDNASLEPDRVWRTDGTAPGTSWTGQSMPDYGPFDFASSESAIYFTTGAAIYRVDATGTHVAYAHGGERLHIASDKLYFSAGYPTLPTFALAVSDGTDASTQMLEQGATYQDYTGAGYVGTLSGGRLLFNTSGRIWLRDPASPPLPSVSGRVFNDLNANGRFDVGEPGVANVQTFLDPDRNGVYTSWDSDRLIETASDGTFKVRWLPSGQHTISSAKNGGPAYQVRTTVGTYTLEASPGATLPELFFGYHYRNTISGRVMNDLDADEIADSGEPGAPGVTVFFDADGDRVLDENEVRVQSGADGRWTVDDLPVGTYQAVTVIPDGWYGTYPLSFATSVTAIAAGSAKTLTTVGISQTPPRTFVSGQVFEDRNDNGILGSGERSVTPGLLLWNDLDDDGVVDPDEPSTTAFSGTYKLYTAIGLNRIRVRPPAGWVTGQAAAAFSLNAGERRIDLNLPVIRPRANVSSAGYDRDTRTIDVRLDTAAVNIESISLPIYVQVRAGADGTGAFISGRTVAILDGGTRLRVTMPASIPDGRYQLIIDGWLLAGSADAVPPAHFKVPFTVLRGDANGDAVVNFADLVLLAQNYNQTGRTFSQGNFDYSADGLVNFADLVLLAQRYGTSLEAPAALAATSSGLPSKATKTPTRRATAVDGLAI